jgi:hypothetical protein
MKTVDQKIQHYRVCVGAVCKLEQFLSSGRSPPALLGVWSPKCMIKIFSGARTLWALTEIRCGTVAMDFFSNKKPFT